MDNLKTKIAHCMYADQVRFRKRLRRIQRTAGEQALQKLERDIQRSADRRTLRLEALPKPSFPGVLPISKHTAEITALIDQHQVVIVSGETGSGKSTQLPKICMSAGRGVGGMIAHTQPRRIAARNVAARIAQELERPLGSVVGYKVRFDASVSPACNVKVVTDGVLLAEIQSDRWLSHYDTIIIDEAHERSLNIDFILGYLKRLLAKRRELKVIVSSATLDTERFSEFFSGAPIVEVSGRGYPIEVRYREPTRALDAPDADLDEALRDAVQEVLADGPGDVLVFFSGEREIRDAAHMLRTMKLDDVEVLPLFARLPFAQQQRVFKPAKGRRIVLSTNVAETSVTVPNVRYVIDIGRARIGRYSHRSTVQRLPIEPISQAAANQRMGRCGRVAPGVCVRLYSEADFLARPAFTEAEIKRTDLAAVVLQLRALGIEDVEAFPFIEQPDRRHVNDALRLLQELGALSERGTLTDVGKRLARLPLDPRIGRILLEASELDCVREVLVIAAALSVPDPRERPPEARLAARAAHERFKDDRSDFVTLLNLWEFYTEQLVTLSSARLRALCKKRFLSYSRLREWNEVHAQLCHIAREMGLVSHNESASFSRLHRALLSGLLRNVGNRRAEREYTGVRDTTFKLSPGSGQYGRGAKWIVAAELIETSELYAHTVARVRAEWIERAARSALRRSYFDAYWDAQRAQVMVFEQSAMFGLVVVPKRRVRYAPVSREGAREIFIRSALVESDFAKDVDFVQHNRAVIEQLRLEEAKLRRPGVMLNDDDIFAFYDSIVPQSVCDGSTFEGWRKRITRDAQAAVRLTAAQIRRSGAVPVSPTQYPASISIGEYTFALSYTFAPGRDDDGVTVTVPKALLGELTQDPFEWLVPGMLREKTEAMLRALPKALRREIAPLTPLLDSFAERTVYASSMLSAALAAHVLSERGVRVDARHWHEGGTAELSAHLQMRFCAVDAAGMVVGSGRDLAILQRELAVQLAGPAVGGRACEPQSQEWQFEELHASAEIMRGNTSVLAYPGLVVSNDVVVKQHFESRTAAMACSREAMFTLIKQRSAKPLRALRRTLPGIEALSLMYAMVAPLRGAPAAAADESPSAELRRHLMQRVVERAYLNDVDLPQNNAEFAALLARGHERLDEVARALCSLCERVLVSHRRFRNKRNDINVSGFQSNYADLDEQVNRLVYRGFVADTPYATFAELPRYLLAAERRLDKLHRGGARDGQKMAQFEQLWRRYALRKIDHDERGREDPELERYRWLLEEYRVSVFAQELGTALPVSRKRLDEQWQKVTA